MNEIFSKRRDKALLSPPKELLADCRMECFRGSGRGGQKRNVTDSAVRLTHQPSGIVAESDATRSQTRNREHALRLLRKRMALHCRAQPPRPPPSACPESKKSPEYCLWVARLLDCLQSANWSVGDCARSLNLSTGKLVRILAADPELWQLVNAGRSAAGFKALKMPH